MILSKQSNCKWQTSYHGTPSLRVTARRGTYRPQTTRIRGRVGEGAELERVIVDPGSSFAQERPRVEVCEERVDVQCPEWPLEYCEDQVGTCRNLMAVSVKLHDGSGCETDKAEIQKREDRCPGTCVNCEDDQPVHKPV